MPAVTFMHSTTHSSQNCGVRIARFAVTLLRRHHALAGAPTASSPRGCHPDAERER